MTKEHIVSIRLTDDQLRALQRYAALGGETPGETLRWLAVHAPQLKSNTAALRAHAHQQMVLRTVAGVGRVVEDELTAHERELAASMTPDQRAKFVTLRAQHRGSVALLADALEDAPAPRGNVNTEAEALLEETRGYLSPAELRQLDALPTLLAKVRYINRRLAKINAARKAANVAR